MRRAFLLLLAPALLSGCGKGSDMVAPSSEQVQARDVAAPASPAEAQASQIAYSYSLATRWRTA